MVCVLLALMSFKKHFNVVPVMIIDMVECDTRTVFLLFSSGVGLLLVT